MIFIILGTFILIALAIFLMYMVIYFMKNTISDAKEVAEEGEIRHKIFYIYSIVFWIILLSFICYILYKLIVLQLCYFLS